MFATRYFRGRAIDIGAGPDGLGRQIGFWPLLKSVDEWEFATDGDAQTMTGVADQTYDTVYSSHCMEHVRDPGVTLVNWMRILKPGGHLVVSVPDFDLYERGQWPSRFNPDHKTQFTFEYAASLLAIGKSAHGYEPIKVERIIEGFDPSLPVSVDQTQTGAECSLEFIVHKP